MNAAACHGSSLLHLVDPGHLQQHCGILFCLVSWRTNSSRFSTSNGLLLDLHQLKCLHNHPRYAPVLLYSRLNARGLTWASTVHDRSKLGPFCLLANKTVLHRRRRGVNSAHKEAILTVFRIRPRRPSGRLNQSWVMYGY